MASGAVLICCIKGDNHLGILSALDLNFNVVVVVFVFGYYQFVEPSCGILYVEMNVCGGLGK